MGTDNPYWCPTRYAAGGFANSTGFPVWLYNFDHVASYKPWPPEEDFCNSHVCKLSSPHGSLYVENANRIYIYTYLHVCILKFVADISCVP